MTRTTENRMAYTYGVVGIIYDANQVDPADAQGWDRGLEREVRRQDSPSSTTPGRLRHGYVQGWPGREHHRQGPVGPGPPDPAGPAAPGEGLRDG